LTFDDGPNGHDTARLLDFLASGGIRAVFCLVGSNIRTPGGPALVRRMVAEGHVIACHSMNHDNMGGWTRSAIATDITTCVDAVLGVLSAPVDIPYFRAPFGSWGETKAVATSLGMQSLAGVNTIDDWVTQDADTLARRLRLVMRPGELVLAHDGGGQRGGTVDAVITVVTERLAEGWRFTLPESR
jgi:endo-1,4-beta-xylanase